jgi:N-acyl-phosphatidylethanolamine-hydrolysing phospholipase D
LPRRLADRALLLALLGLAAIGLPACRVGRASARAVGALFSSPRPVAKNHRPVAADARLAVIWVGHATALVQIEDKVILTDPVFTSSVGQLSKRIVEPGIDPEDLPPIDAVLVSHMHYDHLSLGSLDTIAKKVRTCLLPHGGTTYLTDFSFPAYELTTWQSWEKGGLRVTAVPVDHVGYRYGIDDAWMPDSFTGYVVEYRGLKVYFGGDTAYDQKLFVETGQRFPKIDLALLPIAPIEPHDVMRRFHMDPREAVQAFVDLGATVMVPIHYDTFVNSTDRPGDALRELGRATHRWNLGSRSVVPLPVGERRVFLRPGEALPRGGPSPTPSDPRPAPAPPPTPSATSTIPDEDKFDD